MSTAAPPPDAAAHQLLLPRVVELLQQQAPLLRLAANAAEWVQAQQARKWSAFENECQVRNKCCSVGRGWHQCCCRAGIGKQGRGPCGNAAA